MKTVLNSFRGVRSIKCSDIKCSRHRKLDSGKQTESFCLEKFSSTMAARKAESLVSVENRRIEMVRLCNPSFVHSQCLLFMFKIG